MKVDSFRPNSPIDDPDQFVGRTAAIRAFSAAISQVRVKQPRHLAITGHRGVGKSSFLNQAIRISEGDNRLLDRHGIKNEETFCFRTIRVDATYRLDVPDLCQAFEQRLQSTFSRLKNQMMKGVSFDIGPLKVNFSSFKEKPIGIEETFSQLVMRAFDKWNESETGSLNGIILAVDEVDRIDPKVGVGTFFKLVTEQLSREGYPQVMFILCGQEGSVQKLKEEHESVGRVFNEIPIAALTQDEVKSILKEGFEKADCLMDDIVPSLVLRASRGIGSRVHLIGSHCLQVDNNDYIDKEDVDAAIDLMITETLRSEMGDALRRAGGGKYKPIIEAMAKDPKDIVLLQDIAVATGWEQNEFSTNMGKLLERNILERPEEAHYRFVDPLLKSYIRKFGVGFKENGD